MLKFKKPTNYLLDDNGTDIMTTDGRHVLDLHNDCKIVSFVQNERIKQITIKFEKTASNNPDSIIETGTNFEIVVEGTLARQIRAEDDATTFDGIYDITSATLTLSIGNIVYNVLRASENGPSLAIK